MLEYDLIETPENVELEQRLAGIGTRLIAGVIDHLLIIGLYLVIWLLFLGTLGINLITDYNSLSLFVLAMLIVAAFAIYWGYFAFFEMVWNGQSPGKRRMRIRVVKEGGAALTFTDVAIRNLLRVVDAMPVIIYAVAGVCMFFAKRVQRLGDLAAGTVVTSEVTGDYTARSDRRVSQSWEHEATASALRATGLLPEEYRALSSYHLREAQLTLDARRRLLPQLIGPILKRMGHDPSGESFETLERHLEQLMRKARTAENEDETPEGPV